MSGPPSVLVFDRAGKKVKTFTSEEEFHLRGRGKVRRAAAQSEMNVASRERERPVDAIATGRSPRSRLAGIYATVMFTVVVAAK